jgi:hypothetical protein
MKHLDQIILGIPHLFIKKIPYAWVGVVFLWNWHPMVSVILMMIVVVGTLGLIWQEKAWQRKIISEKHSGTNPIVMDRPHMPRQMQIRNAVLVLIASAILGWLFNGRVDISGIEWFLLLAGFMFLYKDTKLFGAGVTYLITDKGLGIRFIPGHVDYRLFFEYREIRQAERITVPKQLPAYWETLVPRKGVKEGILLHSNRNDGFSKQILGEILISPTDPDGFLAHMARHVPVKAVGLPAGQSTQGNPNTSISAES